MISSSFFFFLDDLKNQLALQRKQKATNGKINLTGSIKRNESTCLRTP